MYKVYQTSWGATTPPTHTGAGSHLIVANFFSFAKSGFIIGARFYRVANDNNEHPFSVMLESDNTLLAMGKFHYASGATPVGWQSAYLGRRLPVAALTNYYLCVDFSGQFYSYQSGALTGHSIISGDITVPADSVNDWNGINGLDFGRNGWNHAAGTRYGVDVIYWRPQT